MKTHQRWDTDDVNILEVIVFGPFTLFLIFLALICIAASIVEWVVG